MLLQSDSDSLCPLSSPHCWTGQYPYLYQMWTVRLHCFPPAATSPDSLEELQDQRVGLVLIQAQVLWFSTDKVARLNRLDCWWRRKSPASPGGFSVTHLCCFLSGGKKRNCYSLRTISSVCFLNCCCFNCYFSAQTKANLQHFQLFKRWNAPKCLTGDFLFLFQNFQTSFHLVLISFSFRMVANIWIKYI